jgi:hypothetical protein
VYDPSTGEETGALSLASSSEVAAAVNYVIRGTCIRTHFPYEAPDEVVAAFGDRVRTYRLTALARKPPAGSGLQRSRSKHPGSITGLVI